MEAPPLKPLLRTISTTSSVDSPSPSFSSSSLTTSSSISSILNNPHSYSASSTWPSLFFFNPSSSSSPSLPDPSSSPSTPLPNVSLSDFSSYLASVSDTFSRFEHIINHSSSSQSSHSDPSLRPGEALLACLRKVPSLFFKEDFQLEDGATFHAACPFSPDPDENLSLQERLTQYLDVVEVGLVREIALRSESFYEAQGRLQGLDGEIVEACGSIRALKETIRALTGDLVGSARQVQELNDTRGNLVALQQKLTVILCVSKELSDLKLLVAQADCVAALDVIDDLQHLLDTDELAGLHCFRHIRDQLATSLASVDSILEAEFVRNAVPDAKAVEEMVLLHAKRKDFSLLNGIDNEANLGAENFDLEARLLPLIYCSSRTAKLPAMLRKYRETLITLMTAAIKTTVAELLPILVARSESDLEGGERAIDSEAGSQSLASKLKNLSSESFVRLLTAIFKIVQVYLTQAAEVKRVVECGMLNINIGPTTPETNEDGSKNILSQNSYSLAKNSTKLIIQGKVDDNTSPSAKNFRADVLSENTEAVSAACEAAHGRWAKLLGVRALLHPKLRLQEFLSIYNITQDFISVTEKIGGRLGYSIRGVLQSQSKSFVDVQHESKMTKIKAVLDQETWVAVDVPEEFQAIVNSLSSTSSVENSIEIVESDNSVSKSAESDVSPSKENGKDEQGSREDKKSEPTGPVRPEENNARSTPQYIVHGGVRYNMLNCGLILLKMLSEYVDISKCLPTLSSEVVHRVVELLKLFNSRTCQLVLGAGAMQVSGLKSITSKHLALASQIISFIFAIIPDIRRVLFLKTPEARKLLLTQEFDRVSQDYKVHRDEINNKLVQIMRERLLANLRKLPQIVEDWNKEDADLQPSSFAKSVSKEVTFLHRILSQNLLEADVQAIFRQVVQIFHTNITDVFSKLELKTPQANNRLCRDAQHILACIRKLPAENFSGDGVPNYGLLDEFLAEKFGAKVGQ
ncbi:Vacuolar protein sorting-associated protein 54 [Rhynchospora pubera]|uniref:Vacuolar protein sorting-associated protein 54 n=1 Tax=Rhynchospora pubera TaxID=906938 RepID=A0AAV8GAF4_9POAL|nr:Vacuolar protein sorting-associated protein 54 [Rhynchospora pubera]